MSEGKVGRSSIPIKELTAAVEEFNRYRSPEVFAKLAGVGNGEVEVIFTGTMCRSCGGQDYLEDFAYEASDKLKIPVTLIEFENGEGGGFRARFLIGRADSS